MKKWVGYSGLRKTLIPVFLLMVASLISCYKNSVPPQFFSPQTPTRDTTLTDSSIYIDVTLNGTRVFRIAGVDSPWGVAWFSGDLPPDTTVIIYSLNRIGGVFDSTVNTYPGLGFSKGDINYLTYGYPQSYYLMNTKVLDSFFQAENYPFSQLSKDTSYTVIYDSNGDTLYVVNPISSKILTPGIQLTWYDSTGIAWKSYLGSGDQSNSYFKIVKTDPYPTSYTIPVFSSFIIITAEFGCNLYNGLGNVIHLTNGRFRLMAFV
ncbi:hypothetical protein [Pedobacter sp.]|jgi:hypothetical protein|uniref:hypothetical protein n=1 Tax=Pedobacter sp. TaxID=1411316 RepID=UPI002C766CD9|nr:hypothetical protein [Pedobacter sp.]HWW41411.1 hypothetical protein [Pedobacter sp.]